jgi:hypothetical protein
MSNRKKVFFLLLTIAAVFYTPYIALYIHEGEIPEGFFHFPADKPGEGKPGPHWLVLSIAALFFLFTILIYFLPRLFRFRRCKDPEVKETLSPTTKKKLPVWFWVGLVMWLTILVLFQLKVKEPKWLMDWALLPLWWGFILMLDGIVYYRAGESLVNDAPTELIAMGAISISGWLIFEYFNFFIKLNWYYPASSQMSRDNFLLYAYTGSSAFIPMCFEWYHFLRSFPKVRNSYRCGPKIKPARWFKVLLLSVCFIGLYYCVHYPNDLFYAIWLCPMIILILVLGWLKIPTPFTPIAEKGDWSQLMLFAPTFFIQGFLVEWWNHMSARVLPDGTIETANPGYWKYCIPYVQIEETKIFEMPFLGYLGYVPFSIYCFIWFIVLSYLLNISSGYSLVRKMN